MCFKGFGNILFHTLCGIYLPSFFITCLFFVSVNYLIIKSIKVIQKDTLNKMKEHSTNNPPRVSYTHPCQIVRKKYSPHLVLAGLLHLV